MIVLPIVLGSAFAVPTFPAADEAAPALAPLSALTAAALLQEEEEESADGIWHGAVNIGLSKSEGNANVESYTLDARAVRQFEDHRYTVDALWFFQRDKDAPGNGILQRRALGSGKYDQFLSEKMYFWVNVLLETNLRALLDLRWTTGAGIGYQLRDDDQFKINTEVGLAYFNEEFDNGDKFDYLAARLAWDVWARVTETVVFGHIAELFPSLDDTDDVYGRANTYFEAQLSERMTARLSWVANYDNTPASVGGQTLKRLDSLYLLTVGWTF